MSRSFVVYLKISTCGVDESEALNFCFLFFSIVYYLRKITFLCRIEKKGRSEGFLFVA